MSSSASTSSSSLSTETTSHKLVARTPGKDKGKGKATEPTTEAKETDAPRHKIRKLAPPRPFPTVPTSVSATGPRSAHTEGKNYVCITRKTPLGAYLRRCKDVFIKDGYKTLHLSAMGAAIPHMLQLSLSLPSILPFPADEVHTEVRTGTVDVQDELIPDDEDEDITYRTRGKSTVSVTIRVGDGSDEAAPPAQRGKSRGKATATVGAAGGNFVANRIQKKGKERARITQVQDQAEQIIYREEDMDES